jgi:ferredoxin
VDCIHNTDDDQQYYINPETCIGCAACRDSLSGERDLLRGRHAGPVEELTDINADWFKTHEVGTAFQARTERH